MQLTIKGAASAELPLRVLGLLAQHGVQVESAQIALDGEHYDVAISAVPLGCEREALIVEKLRSMVLVRAASAA